ncbi:MAG: hypothetical protein H6729_12345 [Deltaproteobacteria bacterium]|nr:hypothetical protein [Deltaproteobacteria bacterium]
MRSAALSALVTRGMLGMLGMLGLLGGCDGCSSGVGGGNSKAPEAFISRKTDLVVQIRDIGVFTADRSKWPALPETLFSGEQREAVLVQMKRDLGFDPTTRAGLTEAGLKTSGPVWIGVKKQSVPEGSEGVLLTVLPVADQARFEQIVAHIIERTGIRPEILDSASHAGVRVTKTPEPPTAESNVAAWAFRDGYAILGLGADPEAAVAEALSLSADQSLAGDPEFRKIAQSLGSEGDLEFRVFMPPLGTAVTTELRQSLKAQAKTQGIDLQDADLPDLLGAGLRVNLGPSTVRVVSRMLFGPVYAAQLKPLLQSVPRVPRIEHVLGLSDAVLRLEWAMPSEAVLPALKDEATKANLPEKISPELLASLLGRGALVVTLRDFAHFAPEQLLSDPSQALSFIFSASTKATKGDGEEQARSLGALIDDLNKTGAMPNEALAYEIKDDTIAIGNDPDLMKTVWSNANGQSLLESKPGIAAELSFAPLVERVKAYPLSEVPLLMRAVVLKAIQVLQTFERARLVVRAEDDGLSANFTLKMSGATE